MNGRRTGVVAHFEDQRALDLAERRSQLLLEAISTVAHATNPTEGLQQLAKIVLSFLPHSFCRILLAEENGKVLTVKVAHSQDLKEYAIQWSPHLNEQVVVTKIPGLAELLDGERPRVLRFSNPHVRNNLLKFSRHLGLEQIPIQSFLLTPLRIDNRLVGVLEIGELRSQERTPIAEQERELASAVAAQTAILIDKLQRQEVNEHRRSLSEKSEDLSRNLVPEKGVDTLLRQAARLAADFLGGTASAIYEYFSGPDSCELRHSYGRFLEILDPQPSLASPLLKQVCQSNEAVIEHLAVDPFQEEQSSHSQMAAIGVPLREPRTGAVEYVLIVIYQPHEHHFTEVDGEFLQRFATRVALTIATAQVMSPEQRRLGLFPLLHKISNYLQSTGDVEKISHVVLTGITTGYGLGFERAALFLMDESQQTLIGKMGIGHLIEDAALHDWEQGPRNRLEDVARYLEILEEGTLAKTPLDRVIRGLRVALNEDEQNPFTRCVRKTSAFIVSETEPSRLPSQFHLAFQPTSDLVFAPVRAGEQVFGVIVADNKFLRHAIRLEDLDLLMALVNTAAIAIANLRLLEQLHNANAAAQTVAEVSALGDLDTTLSAVTQGTLQALDCDAVTLYAYDQITGTLSYPPKSAGVFYEDQVRRDAQVAKDSILWSMLKRDERYVVEKMEADEIFAATRFAKEEQIKSCIALPLRAAGQKVGVMFVNYRTPHHFTVNELTRLQLYANQASVAIHNAQLYEQARKQTQALQALYAAGQAITSSLDSAEVLRRIGEQAWRLTGAHGEHVGFASVWKFNDTQLELVAEFPPSAQERFPRFIDLAPHVTTKIGIVGRVVRQNQPQRVMNVDDDPDYIPANEAMKSELAVPITVDGKVIGAINVEDPHLNAFQEQDQKVLESLAAQAGIAVQNARQHEELNRAKRQLAASTAVAWMGMASATWQHMVRTDAATIRDTLELARQDLEKKEMKEKLQQRLDIIESVATRILELSPTPVLAVEEDTQSVMVNDFVKERVKKDLFVAQVDVVGTSEEVKCKFLFLLSHHSTIRVSPQWFAQALKIILDNALAAMTNSPVKMISVTTQSEDNGVAIMIADTGKGIPEEIRPYLLQEPIKKTRGEKGMGMGLLLAQTIIQACGGEIRIRASTPAGTTINIWLPLESDVTKHAGPSLSPLT